MKTSNIFYLSFFIFLSTFLSCKKIDSQYSSSIEKFFTVNSQTPIAVKRAIDELKRQNAITGFIDDLAKNEGYAIWDKALLRNSGSTVMPFAPTTSSNGDTLVFIPLVQEGGNIVNGFLFFRINVTIESHLYRAKDYDKFEYGGISTNDMSAEKATSMLAVLDASIFGSRKLEVNDFSLFNYDINQYGLNNDSVKTIQVTNVDGKYWIQICEIRNTCPYTPCTGPEGQCDNCPQCVTETCTEIELEGGGGGGGTGWPNDWPADLPGDGGSGGGGGGSGSGGTGGGGDGNCTTNTCVATRTQILEGKLPCGDCGGGPIIILPIGDDPPIEYFDYSEPNNPIFGDPEPLIFNGIDVDDNGPVTLPQVPQRVIAKSTCRPNHNQDLEHGTDGNGALVSNQSLLSYSDNDLFEMFESLINLFSMGDLETTGHEMIQRFRNKSGGTFTSTALNEKVKISTNMTNYLKVFGNQLRNQLNAHNRDIFQVPTFEMPTRPSFGDAYNKFTGLQILVNDTECTDINLRGFQLNSNGEFWAEVEVTIEDHFGLDDDDLYYQDYHQGFAAWWILQHKRDYVPFRTSMKIYRRIHGFL